MKDEILLFDKPAGWTSFDVVAKIRGKIRAQIVSTGEKPTKRQLKVGHAGTLDPFATGLLVILLGDATKKADNFLKLDKTYEFSAKLGEVSTTGDPEGVITPYVAGSKKQEANNNFVIRQLADPVKTTKQHESTSHQVSDIKYPTVDEVKQVLDHFTGEITQVPPAFSAIKIEGQRAYKLAREGKEFDMPSRKVKVYKIQIINYKYPYLKCVCDVSSGTYIRSLVEDIGKALKTGAYCYELRRIKIGKFDIKNAIKVTDLF